MIKRSPTAASLSAHLDSRLRLGLFLCLLLAFAATTADVGLADLFPNDRHSRTTVATNKTLERFHYRRFSLNDAFATEVLEHYFEDLDPARLFFLSRDVERFARESNRLDEDIAKGNLDLAFDVYRVYRARLDGRIDYALSLLDRPFDFNRSESYLSERKEANWAASDAELDETWRRRVKNDYLLLKLANKHDDEIRDRLRRRYSAIRGRMRQFTADEVFQTFISAYLRTVEPHTGYQSPSAAENFDISMRLSLEGVGMVLRSADEYIQVERTTPGGPARQSRQIHPGDRIVGVADGLDGKLEDVVGWRLEDVVDKIRGPQGSWVRLQILPGAAGLGGGVREVSLMRKEITLEDQAATSFVFVDAHAPSLRIGVIQLPAFYRDFQGEAENRKDFRSTTRDMRRLIQELQRDGIHGLVIDLRGNGGGSLTEATSLTGLFIDQGPVVQVKDAFGNVRIESDTDGEVAYAGPLAVLVDRDSASAAEIFAAAIQDYRRGLIVGEPTFGKGTVQTLVDLALYAPGKERDLGRVRLTVAEFFRVSGGSTQIAGVQPDVRLDLGLEALDSGERSLENALPQGRIEPTDYARPEELELSMIRRRSAERVTKDLGFHLLASQRRAQVESERQAKVSLRERERRAEYQRRERLLKDIKARFLLTQGLEPVDDAADGLNEELREREQEAIDRIHIAETARILADLISSRGTSLKPRAATND